MPKDSQVWAHWVLAGSMYETKTKLMAPAITVVILLATKILQNVWPMNKELQGGRAS